MTAIKGTERYYLADEDGPEREVSKERYVSAERRAGFLNTMNQPQEPATAAFSGIVSAGGVMCRISGRVGWIPEMPAVVDTEGSAGA